MTNPHAKINSLREFLSKMDTRDAEAQTLLNDLSRLEQAFLALQTLRDDDCDDDLIRIATDGTAYLVKGKEFDRAIENILKRKNAM